MSSDEPFVDAYATDAPSEDGCWPRLTKKTTTQMVQNNPTPTAATSTIPEPNDSHGNGIMLS